MSSEEEGVRRELAARVNEMIAKRRAGIALEVPVQTLVDIRDMLVKDVTGVVVAMTASAGGG